MLARIGSFPASCEKAQTMKSKRSSRDVGHRREGMVTAKVGSLKYAAMKIGCSLPTLYDLIQEGKLRSYHIGRAHRVSEQAVADCIALLERESAEEHATHSPLSAGSRRPLAE